MQSPQITLKPGVSTSEFWIVVVSGLLLTAQAALSLVDVAWAMGGVTILGLVYTSIRGRLKSIHAQTAADQIKAQINNAPPPSNVIPFKAEP
ncbi:hypothetical protein [Prosthecobacter sp.]|uniref:hypothetical protein n=1 Tax=Prosthecobacter sp. TaxID=1965333 RepID=UPI003784A08B